MNRRCSRGISEKRPRTEPGRFAWRLSLILAPLVLLLLWSDAVRGENRADLGNVLKTIPPNGPFWQYGNVVMRRKTRKAEMPAVVFPHWSHRALYTCRVCHLELGFSMRGGDTGITRSQYTAGKFCGACHDGKTAFTVQGSPGSPACDRCHLKETRQLKARFERFAESLPMAPFGNGVDWAAAVRNGMITPRKSLKPGFSMNLPEKLRAPINLSTTSPRSDVNFSHEEHLTELDCSSCHPDIFNIKKKGTEAFSMERNIFGNFCGACHMQVAFPMSDCKRCHPRMSGYVGF